MLGLLNRTSKNRFVNSQIRIVNCANGWTIRPRTQKNCLNKSIAFAENSIRTKPANHRHANLPLNSSLLRLLPHRAQSRGLTQRHRSLRDLVQREREKPSLDDGLLSFLTHEKIQKLLRGRWEGCLRVFVHIQVKHSSQWRSEEHTSELQS